MRSATDLQEIATLAESSDEVDSVLYSPADEVIAFTNKTGALKFIRSDIVLKGDDDGSRDINANSIPKSIQQPGATLIPLRFTPNGERLLVLARGRTQPDRQPHNEKTIGMCVYRVSDQQLLAQWTTPPELCAAISPDGSLVVTGHEDGVRFWSIEDPVTTTHVPVGGFRDGIDGTIWCVDFSPDGRHVVAGANINGRIEIIDVSSKQLIDHLQGHLGTVFAVRFSPDGKRIASGGESSSEMVKLWDFETRRELMTLTIDAPWGRPRHIEWQPDGNGILVGAGDSILNLFRVPSLEEIEVANSN